MKEFIKYERSYHARFYKQRAAYVVSFHLFKFMDVCGIMAYCTYVQKSMKLHALSVLVKVVECPAQS